MSEPQQNEQNPPWRTLLVPAIVAVLVALIAALATLLKHDPAPSPTPSTSAFSLPPGTTTTSLPPTSSTGPRGSIRRDADLTLRLGQHADLDSIEPDWNQSRAGYKGDIYFDTGREAGRAPRIQPGLSGPGEQYTTVVPLGRNQRQAATTCTAKLRESPDPRIPIERLVDGYQLCVKTGEQRWAFLTVAGRPDPEHISFSVVVWEK
jgi:hypothetical protein